MTSDVPNAPRTLHGPAIVLGAFLLFLVQPMAARAILPWFGGSAAVWITCLVFFQVGLFFGYLYAHALVRFLPPRAQAVIHLALLAAAAAFLPINPSAAWKPLGAEDPSLRILGLLAASVGLPYVLLAATSPLLQAWSLRSRPEGLPWRLFAVSNAGSLVALLSYPFLVEPFLGVSLQLRLWSAAFAVFAALIAAVAWRDNRFSARATFAPPTEPFPPRLDTAHWLLLSACSAILLTSVSSHLTQNIAGIPFLWILPLSLYLVTFILCFDGNRWYRRGVFVPLLFPCLWAATYLLGPDTEGASLWIVFPVFAGGLFVCCMICHGELARLRPHPAHLTSFYLAISAGGALGALFVGLVAPRIFSGIWELPLGLAACTVFALSSAWRRPPHHIRSAVFRPAWAAAAVVGALTVAGMGLQVKRQLGSHRLMARDFHGGVSVTERRAADGSGIVRILLHGVINHGEQDQDPVRRRQATSYFGPGSGAALALTRSPRPDRQRVGIIGLGTGTLAALGRAGDEYRFYEISALVIELARTEFTYLADSAAHVEVILGDGRLTLEREEDQRFDVLVVDAFSGDAVPTHLLTREAFSLYRRHVRAGGSLVVHITNRYVDLAPVVARAAADLGLHALQVSTLPDPARLREGSTWVLLGDNLETAGLVQGVNVGRELVADLTRRPWTDDYSDILGTLKFGSTRAR